MAALNTLTTRTYLTGERAIERLAEVTATALEHHQAENVSRKAALTDALDAARQAVGYAMHAVHLIRSELVELEAPS